MKSTWSPLYRGLLPAAACGPPGKKRFGKPAVWTPRNVCGPSAQWSSSARPLPAADPHARERAGAEVEAGRPHDDVELPHAVGRLDPALGHAHDRRLLEVDERDVRVVVRLVVAGHERRPLLAEAVVLGDQPLRRLGILDDAADLVGDELAPLRVGGRDRTAGRCSCW